MQLATARETLEQMKGNYYFIDGAEETIEAFSINTTNEVVSIRTDFKQRTCKLSELGNHLKIYSKNKSDIAVKEDSSGLALLEKLPENPNLAYVEEALIASLKKLQNGDKDHIPVAESTNRLATTILNIQKSKIEMGKLIIEAHKTKK